LFGFGTLFYVSLLCVNAIAILNEERFLAQIGLASSTYDPNSFKHKLVTIISSVRTLLRVPLVALNILVIIYELLLG
ncbi:Yos1-like protein, partial [Globomyces pollinis-pini]